MASGAKPTGPMSRKSSPTNTRRVVKGGERQVTSKRSAGTGTRVYVPPKPGGISSHSDYKPRPR